MSNTYKLHYFNWRGGIEGIRLLFAYAKVPFEDIRYERNSFDKERDTFPYKQLPVLEMNGKYLAQSYSILRFLSNEFGLAGKDKWETAKIDELMELLHEPQEELKAYYGTVWKYGEGERKDLKKTKLIPFTDKYFPLFEKAIDSTGTGFYSTNGPCGFDFWMCEYIDMMAVVDSDIFLKHGKLIDHVKRVHSLPELQDYLSKRPPRGNLP